MPSSAVRRRRELESDLPIVEALSDVLAETLDDLRNERIRARRSSVRTRGWSGRWPRADCRDAKSEAPLEYLGRVLDVVQASAHSVRRLTQLFQRAASARTRSTPG